MNWIGFLLIILVFACIYTGVEKQEIRSALMIAFAGHLFIGLLLLPRLPYAWDINLFHQNAITILEGSIPNYSQSVNSFAAFQALVYATIGSNPDSLIIVNSVLAVLTPVPMIYLARKLYPSVIQSTDGIFLFVLFMPVPFFFTTLPMRDTLSVLMFFSLLALVTSFLTDIWSYSWLIALPLGAALYLLRSELVFIIVASMLVAFTLLILDHIFVNKIEFSSLLGLLSPLSIPTALIIANRIPAGVINQHVQARARGGAAYLEGMAYETGYDILFVAPVRAIYFQFAPFPLHVNAVFDLVVMLMLPLLIFLIISTYRSLMRAETARHVAVFLVLVYISGAIGYGIIDSNFGTTARHRIPFTFLLVVFAGPEIQRWELALRRRFSKAQDQKRHKDE